MLEMILFELFNNYNVYNNKIVFLFFIFMFLLFVFVGLIGSVVFMNNESGFGFMKCLVYVKIWLI